MARLLRALAVDHRRGLPRVEIHEPQLTLRGAMRVPEVRGDHAQHLSAIAEHGRGLSGAIAGGADDVDMPREEGVDANVFDDDAFPESGCLAAGRRPFV